MAKHVHSASVVDALPLSLTHPFAMLPDDAPLLIGRALEAPHWRLTEPEAGSMVAPMCRSSQLRLGAYVMALASERDGRPGYELPNHNALLIAGLCLKAVLSDPPRAVSGEG